jgi:hypothetical protein
MNTPQLIRLAGVPRKMEFPLFLVAVCVGSALSHMGTSTMPFQIGALVEGTHRSAAEAGIFGFLQIAALSLGMMLVSPWVGRVAPRRIAFAGSLLIVLGGVGLYRVDALLAQWGLAIVVGLGYGFIFAATVSAAAASRDPDRVYAIGNGGALLLIVGIMTLLPAITTRWGPLGIFAALSVLAALISPFFAGFKSGERLTALGPATWRISGALGLLVIWTLASIGTSALYVFSERLGSSIHLPGTQIASVLSAGVFVGLIGSATSALLGARVNRSSALLIGMGGVGVACLTLGCAHSLWMYAAGVFLYWIFYMFLYSFLLGTAALLDPAGRLGTLAGGLERMGYAVGAACGGFLTEHLSYQSTGLLACGCCLLGLALGFPSLHTQFNQHHPKASRPQTQT